MKKLLLYGGIAAVVAYLTANQTVNRVALLRKVYDFGGNLS